MQTTAIVSLDAIGAVASLISTCLYINARVLAWPFAMMTVLINGLLYILTGLYADAAKEAIYCLSNVLGWCWWTQHQHDKNTMMITRLTVRHGVILALIAMPVMMLSVFLLKYWGSSTVPYWDTSTTVLSLTAQWLICRKIIECWILWGIVDALYSGLYFYKGLPIHGTLLILYTIMAIIGYLQWQKQLRSRKRIQCFAADSPPSIQSGMPTPP